MKGGGKAKAETTTRKAANKLAVKKTAGKGAAKKEKQAKDPNKPKRPPSAFFVFMEEFRQTYKEEHPNNKSVAVVGKAGGNEWKSMSDKDKAPYVEKADKRKIEYNKKMDVYNKKQAGQSDAAEEEDESDKSKSEVNDDEDDSGEV
ncbi:hypothetical protein Sjap_017555 [Stephania japonica]|uniref:HMG box domain-containing protein n=1 Tax=Stephania japonica TaxID=461633 RepID=A0AAP0NKH9_9MAGN